MSSKELAVQKPQTRSQRFAAWMQDPMGSIIFASIIAIGSLAFVGSGIWIVDAVIV